MQEETSDILMLIPLVIVFGGLAAGWLYIEYLLRRQNILARKFNRDSWKKHLRIVRNAAGELVLQEFRCTTPSVTGNVWDSLFVWVPLAVFEDTDSGRAAVQSQYSAVMEKGCPSLSECMDKLERMCRHNTDAVDITDEIIGAISGGNNGL